MSIENRVEWRAVVGFEGVYEVSSDGQVRSVDRYITQDNRGTACTQVRRGKLLAPVTINGYRKIKLWSENRSVMRGVHRLMAEAFIGACPVGMEVCHRDGNRSNNVLGNLRYGTPLDNGQDRVAHGNSRPGSQSHLAKLTEETVVAIRSAASQMTRKDIANHFRVSTENVGCILRRQTWRHT